MTPTVADILLELADIQGIVKSRHMSDRAK
jgi:hypothetical protein